MKFLLRIRDSAGGPRYYGRPGVAQLSHATDRQYGPAALIYTFGDCELDTERYELRRRGIARPVEPQVLDVLLHFVQNPGRLVTKEELHETIWKGRIVSDSALSSRINAARRAIGDRGSEAGHIRTVFSRGFRFVGPVKSIEVPGDVAARAAAESRLATGGARRSADPAGQPGWSSRAYLRGYFACYSHASSPAFAGKVIRGSLVVDGTPPAGPLRATYSESLAHRTLRFAGPLSFCEQVMYLDLVDARTGVRVFMNLLCPGPPASALVGAMSGRVIHDPNSELAVTRMLVIRVPRAAQRALERSNRYLDPAETSVARDACALGLPLDRAPHLESLLNDFLNIRHVGSLMRVSAADNQAVNVGIDRVLGEAGGAAGRPSASRAPRRLPAMGRPRRR